MGDLHSDMRRKDRDISDEDWRALPEHTKAKLRVKAGVRPVGHYIDAAETYIKELESANKSLKEDAQWYLRKAESDIKHIAALQKGIVHTGSMIDTLQSALQDLINLKDGPRDYIYEKEKPLAWEKAREALRKVGGEA